MAREDVVKLICEYGHLKAQNQLNLEDGNSLHDTAKVKNKILAEFDRLKSENENLRIALEREHVILLSLKAVLCYSGTARHSGEQAEEKGVVWKE